MDERSSEQAAQPVTEAPSPACGTCGGTGKVMLSLTGASGAFTRDVPCTECKAGVTLDSGGPDVIALRRTVKQVALIAIGAFILGLLAYLMQASGIGKGLPVLDLKKVSPPE
jgi:sulfopyruvate decarboxylase TPP-binding subunit